MAQEAKDTTRIYLEDHGQDFLWFDVTRDEVTGCGPFQAWLWVGKKLRPPIKWKRGSRVIWKDGSTLRYPVTRTSKVGEMA